jgi:hypothetical protein
VYVYRANHGQWNTVWGSADGGPTSRRVLDLRGFITQAEQRRFAEVYITAFLEASLRNRAEYLPLFRDHRVAGQWLPKTMYITRFEDSDFRSVAGFEEDVDVTTATVSGATLRGDSLSTWKESAVPFRFRGGNMAHNAVTLAWNRRIAGDDTTKRGMPGSYALTLSDSLRTALQLDGASTLVFSLAPTDAKPGPRQPAKDTTKKADSTAKKPAAKKPKPPRPAGPDTVPMDLSIEVADAGGRTSRVALSTYGPVRRPLESHVYRRAGRDKLRFATTFEIVMQTYTIPLADFARVTPGLELNRLTSVRWVFDRTEAGTVYLDNVGFSRMRPEFFVTENGR